MITADIETIHQFGDKIFKKEDLDELFSRKICSTHGVNVTLDRVYGELSVKAKNEGQVILDFADIQLMLSSIKSSIANKEREVTDEKPYSR